MTQIFREANRCIDKLANMGATQHMDFLLLYEPPSVVDNMLAFNKAELFCKKQLSLCYQLV